MRVVAALTRELMWVLSILEVRPDMRRRGVGRQLLEAGGDEIAYRRNRRIEFKLTER